MKWCVNMTLYMKSEISIFLLIEKKIIHNKLISVAEVLCHIM